MRAKTIKNILETKHARFEFTGCFLEVFGRPSKTGCWLIYGAEKQGKTSFSLKFAEYLSSFEKVLYISAEEGDDLEFQENIQRMNIDDKNKNLHVLSYIPFEGERGLIEKLSKKKSPNIIFLDNMTIYSDEISKSYFIELLRKFPRKLFVAISHEEQNKPVPAISRQISKLAKRIVRVKGLLCEVSGRGPGGFLVVDEEKAMLHHGSNIDVNNKI